MAYSKQEARNIIQSRLDRISDSAYQDATKVIFSKAVGLLQEQLHIKRVLLYQSYTKWREVDLSGLESAFPAVQFDYAPTTNMPLPVDVQYDVIFVPLYGFTSDKYRLGHGSGWYDRLLAVQKGALKVGVGLETGRIIIPIEPHDVPLDVIITEFS